MDKGILIVNSAGGYGPYLYSIKSHAPWILTVAANATNRRIVDKLPLEMGEALIYGKEGASNCCETEARNCMLEYLCGFLYLSPELHKFAIRILSLTCSATGLERNGVSSNKFIQRGEIDWPKHD